MTLNDGICFSIRTIWLRCVLHVMMMFIVSSIWAGVPNFSKSRFLNTARNFLHTKCDFWKISKSNQEEKNLKNNMENIIERYTSYRSEVQEYMNILIAALESKYGHVTDAYIISLDLLAHNFNILFAAIDEMAEHGFSETDKYGNRRKSGAVQIFNVAQLQIHKILSSFGWSPMSASKIKDNQNDLNMKEYLNDLVNG